MENEIIAFIQQYGGLASPVLTITGAILNAFFFRRKTKKAAQIQELEKLKAGMLQETAEELLESGKITYSELYKMKNFMQIAKLADEEFNRERPIETLSEQDFDWYTRFYESCGYISDEEMQTIWARILAGEVRKPGTYSLRTLETLRNLSKEEAVLFTKVCAASIKARRNVILPRIDSYLKKKGITYDDILLLADCGLLKSDKLALTLEADDKYGIMANSKSWALLARKRPETIKDQTHVLRVDSYLFTRSGTELFSVIGTDADRDFEEIADLFNAVYSDFEFARGQEIRREGDKISYVPVSAQVSTQSKQDDEIDA